MTPTSGAVAKWTVLLTVAFLVQVAIVNQITVLGVHPELMLLVAIIGGMVGGPERGAGVGFVSGLLIDLTLHGTLGVTAFCYTFVGFFVGVVQESMLRSSRALSVAIAFVASAAGVLLYASVAQLLGERTFSDPKFGSIVAIVAVLNALLCIPVLSLGRRTEGTRPAF